MKVTRARAERCAGCGRKIPAWWFRAGDRYGWWHWSCILRDHWRKSRSS